MRNISEGGALLEFLGALHPPVYFSVEIGPTAAFFECEVRHRGQHGIGVQFMSGDASGILRDLNRPVREEIKPEAAVATSSATAERPQAGFDALAFRRKRTRAA